MSERQFRDRMDINEEKRQHKRRKEEKRNPGTYKVCPVCESLCVPYKREMATMDNGEIWCLDCLPEL